jgi:hypothetical protein
MVAGREMSNPEMLAAYGVKLDGKDRARLNQLGWVASRKVARGAFAHELTDRGWRACVDHLTAAPPRGARSLDKTLYAVLGGLKVFLDRSNLRLADVFGEGPVDRAADTAGAVGAAEAADVEARIRAAYRKLVGRPRGWVGLADLRRQLDGIAERDVDAALKALHRSPHANLVPESNQKALTAEDRRAAVHIGGEDKHLLSIEDA